MGPRYAEGYTKGVHDQDAIQILAALAPIHLAAGLLRYSPATRACGLLFWQQWNDHPARETMAAKLRSFSLVRKAFPTQDATSHPCVRQLVEKIGKFVDKSSSLPFAPDLAEPAAGVPVLANDQRR